MGQAGRELQVGSSMRIRIDKPNRHRNDRRFWKCGMNIDGNRSGSGPSYRSTRNGLRPRRLTHGTG